jgi:hypothetical protein
LHCIPSTETGTSTYPEVYEISLVIVAPESGIVISILCCAMDLNLNLFSVPVIFSASQFVAVISPIFGVTGFLPLYAIIYTSFLSSFLLKSTIPSSFD